MVDAGGARDVDAAVDRVNPGGAGERHHHAGGAEDGEAAENAESRVPGLSRELLAIVHRHRSEEHTSELQSLMRISYAVFCLKKKKNKTTETDMKHECSTLLENRQMITTSNKSKPKHTQ